MLLLFLKILVPYHLMAAHKYKGSKHHKKQLSGEEVYRALMR